MKNSQNDMQGYVSNTKPWEYTSVEQQRRMDEQDAADKLAEQKHSRFISCIITLMAVLIILIFLF